jgi:hypothetical protein
LSSPFSTKKFSTFTLASVCAKASPAEYLSSGLFLSVHLLPPLQLPKSISVKALRLALALLLPLVSVNVGAASPPS